MITNSFIHKWDITRRFCKTIIRYQNSIDAIYDIPLIFIKRYNFILYATLSETASTPTELHYGNNDSSNCISSLNLLFSFPSEPNYLICSSNCMNFYREDHLKLRKTANASQLVQNLCTILNGAKNVLNKILKMPMG
jgi:hypothetical protein